MPQEQWFCVPLVDFRHGLPRHLLIQKHAVSAPQLQILTSPEPGKPQWWLSPL